MCAPENQQWQQQESDAMTVLAELSKATKLSYKGNNPQAFLDKVLTKVDGLSDSAWEKFSEETQAWVKEAIDAKEKESDIPLPEGMEESEVEEETEEVEASADNEDEQPKKKAKGKKETKPAKKARSNGKSSDEDEDEDEEEKPKKKTKGGGRRGRGAPPPFSETAKIKILVKNPHREGSLVAQRYALLKNGMTCKQAREAGLSWLDLKCDVDRENLEIK